MSAPSFTPTFSKHQGERSGGAQLHVTDRDACRSVRTTLRVIELVRSMYPADFRFHPSYFDRIVGTSAVREAIEAGRSVDDVMAFEASKVQEFQKLRQLYLLYEGREPSR